MSLSVGKRSLFNITVSTFGPCVGCIYNLTLYLDVNSRLSPDPALHLIHIVVVSIERQDVFNFASHRYLGLIRGT